MSTNAANPQASGAKVTFKIILTSDKKQPYKVCARVAESMKQPQAARTSVQYTHTGDLRPRRSPIHSCLEICLCAVQDRHSGQHGCHNQGRDRHQPHPNKRERLSQVRPGDPPDSPGQGRQLCSFQLIPHSLFHSCVALPNRPPVPLTARWSLAQPIDPVWRTPPSSSPPPPIFSGSSV